MKLVLTLLAAGVLSGCANVHVTQPEARSIERSKTFDMPFASTWINAVDWFADHNVSIDKIEKTSGLLTAKYAVEVDQNYLDCGTVKHKGLLKEPIVSRTGTLNVTVREVSQSASRVNVNFFGEYQLQGLDAWDARPVIHSGPCKSTGLIEKSILQYIATHK